MNRAKHWKFNTRWDDPSLEWVTGPTGNRSAMLDIGDESVEDRPMVVVVDYAPGARVLAHHHETDYLSVLVRGEMRVTGRSHTVGSMRLVGEGTAYGPLEVGPEGCTVIDVFLKRSGLAPAFETNSGASEGDYAERKRKLADRSSAVTRRRS